MKIRLFSLVRDFRKPFAGAICLTFLQIAFVLPVDAQTTAAEAAQFLEQATFGPNAALIAQVQNIGPALFIEEQFLQSSSNYVTNYPSLPLQPLTVPMTCTGTCLRDNYSMYPVQLTFFKSALGQNGRGDQDQLRQRVAFALQQIFVTSGITVTQPSWMTPYLQIFERDAFANFRQILQDVTLNPAMGLYLNMAGNTKTAPNENYGREVLQLFTIGLNVLNPDGSVVTNTKGPVPSYTQAIVDAFSKVFTGWNYCAALNTTTCQNFVSSTTPDYIDPMVVTPSLHDGTAKTLLNGFQLPARTPVTVATANQDLSDALDNIFNHQNVGPFIGRNLIEHLVTSNPSPAYIKRVTDAFNGTGPYGTVRGDMQSVIKAILLDSEARNAPAVATFGHLLEPIVFKTRMLREFNTNSTTTDFVLSDSYLPSELNMGQDLFRSGSVFNYYPPMFNIPGVNVNGPEFALQSTSTALARVNFVAETTYHTMSVSNPNRPTGSWLNLAPLASSFTSVNQLLDSLNTIMRHGQMSADLRATVSKAIAALPSNATSLMKVQEAVYLIASSPEYFVQN